MAESTSIEVAQQPTQLARAETFAPRNITEALEFAKMVLESGFAPKAYVGKPPSSVVIALQLGMELGLQPMQALQSIALINNTPAVFGDTALALIKAHPAFEGISESLDDTTMTATCTVRRRGETPVTRTFSKVDAATAKLWEKDGPWKTYPKRMLQMRARSFALRDQFPDALKGIPTVEEARDYPSNDGKTIEAEEVSSSPVQSVQEDPIGPEKASDFFKAYKANGWTPDEAKKFLANAFQLGNPHNNKDSRSIPKSRFDEAMKWATTKAPVRVDADRLLELLGFTNEEKAKFVNDRKYDWSKIVSDAQEEIGRRNSQEQ